MENPETQNQNQYEVTCVELVGGHTPRHGLEQEDLRPIPAAQDLENAIGDVLDILEELTVDTKLEDDYVAIVSGLTTSVHYVLGRLERKQDDTSSEIRRLTREFDGSEVADHQLQQQTNLMKQNDERAEGLEALRDTLSEFLLRRHSHPWQPPRGSFVSERNGKHAAVVEARDFLKAREERKHAALIPEGSKVGFAGGKDYQDHTTIWKVLDNARQRHPDMVLVHGGAPGAEFIAGKWAKTRGVAQIVCKPDWKAHNKAAPFRRNDEMLALELIGLVATSGSGITDNLVDKARAKRVPVKLIG